jgi:hypothetical protein
MLAFVWEPGGEHQTLESGGERVGRTLGICRSQSAECGPDEVGAQEIGTTEDGPAEIGKAEVGAVEVGPVEVGAAKFGATLVGPAEAGRVEVGATQVGPVEWTPITPPTEFFFHAETQL